MSGRFTAKALGLAGVIALIVAACGGGAEPTATPKPAPTPTTAVATPTSVPTPTPRPTATPTPSGPQPRYGGVLQVRRSSDAANWDTYHVAGGFNTMFLQNLLNNLTGFQKGSNSVIEGDTAESWELSADGKVYTFKLRRDVKFHDGTPFTSADAIYNFQRASDSKTAWNRERVAAIASMEAPDPYTFKITLKRVSASFLPSISSPFLLMYPAHITDMAEWQKTAVGTGPFTFKELKLGAFIDFRKNADYFKKDAAGRQLPYLDGVFIHIIADPALTEAALRTGRLHCGCWFDSDVLTAKQDALRRTIPGIKLTAAHSGTHSLTFNLKRAPWNNDAFRQAVAIGFDKVKVASIAHGGTSYTPASPLLPPEIGGQWGLPKDQVIKIPGYNPDHSVDVALAQQKFRESGIDPKSVQFDLDVGSFFGAQAEVMATVLSELGIKVTPRIVPPVEGNKRLIEGTFDVANTAIGPSIDDPADQYAAYMASNGTLNYGKYANPRVDQLLEQQEGALDPAKRRALVWELQRVQLEDAAVMPFWWLVSVRGTRPEVVNYKVANLSVTSSFRVEEVWLER